MSDELTANETATRDRPLHKRALERDERVATERGRHARQRVRIGV